MADKPLSTMNKPAIFSPDYGGMFAYTGPVKLYMTRM